MRTVAMARCCGRSSRGRKRPIHSGTAIIAEASSTMPRRTRSSARGSLGTRGVYHAPEPSGRLGPFRRAAMIRPYKGIWPKLGERVYVDPSAQVIGDVELGDHASVWMNAVVRGDVHSIRIGAHSNIQDCCVVHVFKDQHPTVLADHVAV